MSPAAGRRVALVTGASRGIGAATAVELARTGHDLVLAARTPKGLHDTAEEVRAAGGSAQVVACDVIDPGALTDLVAAVGAEQGRLDVLVNNAGVLPEARRTERFSRAEWDDVLELNLHAPWFLACRAKELMTTGGGAGGVVVNLASTAGFYPSRGLVAYHVSKAAVIALTRALALEWARDGVRVVAVAPGKVATEMVEPILAWVERTGTPLNPLGRIAAPQEVAGLIAFLCDDRASYMTGSIVTTDGGELLASGADLAR